ncbi:hypothetical protein ON010_g3014 [Phytophthora cinnamomi]|nr:hypothetical protein ON010_g3014 [Phytophthora cinnamomi]
MSVSSTDDYLALGVTIAKEASEVVENYMIADTRLASVTPRSIAPTSTDFSGEHATLDTGLRMNLVDILVSVLVDALYRSG